MPTTTTNLAMTKPDAGQSNWAGLMNANLDILDAKFPGGLAGISSIGLSLPGEFSVSGSPLSANGTITGSWVSQAANKVFAAPSGGSGTPGFRLLVASDVPALAYVTSVGASVPSWLTVSGSPVTGSGTLAITATTGQTQNQFIATPNGSAGAVGLRSIVAADLPDLSSTYLSLAGGSVAGTEILAPLGVATSSSVFNSNILKLRGSYFTLGAAANDDWSLQSVIQSINAPISNVSETAGNAVTLTISGGTFSVGQTVTLTGLTVATWLNNQNVTLTGANATTLNFNDPTLHGVQSSTAETGRATLASPQNVLAFTRSGATGDSIVSVPAGSATSPGLQVGAVGFGIRQTATQLHFFVNGAANIKAIVSGGVQFDISTAAVPSWYSINNDCMWRRLGSRIWESGGVDSATPVASTIQIGETSRPGTDSNVGGGAGIVRTGNGTGTGALPVFTEQTPAPVASGTGAQSYVSRRVLGHSNAALVNNTATLFCRVNANSLTSMALLVSYTVEVKTATDVQIETGFVSFTNVTNSTPTITIGTAVKSGTLNLPSSGTLAVSFAGTVNGSSVDYKITSNSSLTPTTHRVMFEIINLGFHSSDISLF
jgi:hypothetical protein